MTLQLPAPTNTSVLGAHLTARGCRFALWAPRATRVELALVAEDRSQVNVDMTPDKKGVWSVYVPGVKAAQRYGFRVHGEWDPSSGQRFNPAKLLCDPYARAITAGVDYSGPIRDHTAESNYLPDPVDSAFSVPLSVVVADTPAPIPLKERIKAEDLVIYETHVKGFTQTHPAVPEHLRGTYAGLAYPAVIEHLKATGVNAIQLLPIHQFVSEPFVIGRGLTNFWGYNTLGFFAPHAAYCSVTTLGGQVREFKEMVSAYHEAGIAVFLDVVYNHTGEGGHEGPTLSFRGIDHGGYYRLTGDMRNDYDVTGCGNSVDTSQRGVLNMVLDSLRYWVAEMGVDGFRFDLATTLIRDGAHGVDQNHPFKQAIENDPTFEGIHMIAEPWDMGPYGYQVGNWGPRWSEWNDHFRGFARDFWRGAVGGVQELATRLSGSPDVYDVDGRPPTASVNFITAHDGFTLRDLVTYNGKHNDANGEGNRDGSDDNRSWNCGVEGETDDPYVIGLRHRQVKNIMATMLLSNGIPMITAGDEIGRTQFGNNNAYCQDSPISWLDWTEAGQWQDLWELTATLLRMRAEHDVWRPGRYLGFAPVVAADGTELERMQLAWLNESGGLMGDGDWHDGNRRTVGMYQSDVDSAFLVWFHADANPTDITLPGEPWGSGWTVVAHTGEDHEIPGGELPPGTHVMLPGRTVLVLKANLAPSGPEPDPAIPAGI